MKNNNFRALGNRKYFVYRDGAQVGHGYDSKVEAEGFAEFLRYYRPLSDIKVQLAPAKETKDGDPNA